MCPTQQGRDLVARKTGNSFANLHGPRPSYLLIDQLKPQEVEKGTHHHDKNNNPQQQIIGRPTTVLDLATTTIVGASRTTSAAAMRLLQQETLTCHTCNGRVLLVFLFSPRRG